MSHTQRVISAAIAAAILFLGPFLGCSPDLERRATALEISLAGVPSAAQLLRAEITREDSTYTTEATVGESGGVLRIESVPEGEAELRVQALEAGAVIAERTRQVTVDVAQDPYRVSFNFELPQNGQVRSSPISSRQKQIDQSNISGGQLIVPVEVDPAPFRSFSSNAEGELGRAPDHVWVESVTVQVAPIVDARSLDRLWDGTIQVAIEPTGGSTPVVVASGAAPEGVVMGPIAVKTPSEQQALDQIRADVLSGAFRVVLSGVSKEEPGDDFKGGITVVLTLVASVD